MRVRVHKKPDDATPSNFLRKYAEVIATNANGPIVDVPCGYGRNAIYLSSFGVPVLCVDKNKDALVFIQSSSRLLNNQKYKCDSLNTLEADLVSDPWPFDEKSIGAIINIHYLSPKILDSFIRSLRTDSYLLIETVGGHGNNYLHLPPLGYMKHELEDSFEIIYLSEKRVGPPESKACSVKLFAKKVK